LDITAVGSARNRAAALTPARLFFGDFLLAKQKKVTALSGAYPDTSRARRRKTRQFNPVAGT
jgi:hypothetical protein